MEYNPMVNVEHRAHLQQSVAVIIAYGEITQRVGARPVRPAYAVAPRGQHISLGHLWMTSHNTAMHHDIIQIHQLSPPFISQRRSYRPNINISWTTAPVKSADSPGGLHQSAEDSESESSNLRGLRTRKAEQNFSALPSVMLAMSLVPLSYAAMRGRDIPTLSASCCCVSPRFNLNSFKLMATPLSKV